MAVLSAQRVTLNATGLTRYNQIVERHLSRMKPCPYCGAQYPDDAVVSSVDGHKLEDPKPQEESGNTAAVNGRCPACGTPDDYAPAVDLRGSFSWPLFFAGGVFAVVFRNAGRQRKVRCNKCGTLFEIRARLTR